MCLSAADGLGQVHAIVYRGHAFHLAHSLEWLGVEASPASQDIHIVGTGMHSFGPEAVLSLLSGETCSRLMENGALFVSR